jgi:hypothetical protein
MTRVPRAKRDELMAWADGTILYEHQPISAATGHVYSVFVSARLAVPAGQTRQRIRQTFIRMVA